MKQYVFINRVPANYDRTDAQKVNSAWTMLTQSWKEKDIFVSSFVFPAEGYLVSGDDTTVSNGYQLTDGRKIVSVITVKAENYEDAVGMAAACPHIAQSGSVEVRAVM